MQKYSKNKIWFLGRGFEEYILMFDLDIANLSNCRVLDCNAGSSSFTTYMDQKGFDVMATDICYGQDPEEMEKISEKDFFTLMNAHKNLQDKVEWVFFKNHDDMVNYRIKVYHDFSEHYKKVKEEFYVESELPELPFLDDSFHLVLSSHLLFLYDDRLDYDFHFNSINEMLRVSSEEVRIYPLVSLRSHYKSKFVDQLINDLSSEYQVKVQKVNYHFRQGADEMLCIQKNPKYGDKCGLVSRDIIKVEGK